MASAEVLDEWDGPLDPVLERIGSAERCSALLTIWKAAGAGRDSPPARSTLDPIVLAKAGLLPFIWLLERDEAGEYFYRLVGEGIRKYFTSPMRGRYLRDVFDDDMLHLVSGRCTRILTKRLVMFTSGTVYRDGDPLYYARRILLPLCDEEGTPRFVIGTVDQTNVGNDFNRIGSPRFTNDFIAFLKFEDL
ncbi:MAG: PAS domain-containing protein [Thalassobaculaceae bacterium]|nr:PAS domain-containing protein [Thalassobaculaceae bacterium]